MPPPEVLQLSGHHLSGNPLQSPEVDLYYSTIPTVVGPEPESKPFGEDVVPIQKVIGDPTSRKYHDIFGRVANGMSISPDGSVVFSLPGGRHYNEKEEKGDTKGVFSARNISDIRIVIDPPSTLDRGGNERGIRLETSHEKIDLDDSNVGTTRHGVVFSLNSDEGDPQSHTRVVSVRVFPGIATEASIPPPITRIHDQRIPR